MVILEATIVIEHGHFGNHVCAATIELAYHPCVHVFKSPSRQTTTLELACHPCIQISLETSSHYRACHPSLCSCVQICLRTGIFLKYWHWLPGWSNLKWVPKNVQGRQCSWHLSHLCYAAHPGTCLISFITFLFFYQVHQLYGLLELWPNNLQGSNCI